MRLSTGRWMDEVASGCIDTAQVADFVPDAVRQEGQI